MILFGNEEIEKQGSNRNYVNLPKEGESIKVIPTAFWNASKANDHKIEILDAGQQVNDYLQAGVDKVQIWLDQDDFKRQLDDGNINKDNLRNAFPSFVKLSTDADIDVAAWIASQSKLEMSVKGSSKYGMDADKPISVRRERYLSVLVQENGEWVEGVLSFNQKSVAEALNALDSQADDGYGIFGKEISISRSGKGNKTTYSASFVFGSKQKEIIKDIKIENPSFSYIPVAKREDQLLVLKELGLTMPEVPAKKQKELNEYNTMIENIIALKNKETTVDEIDETEDKAWQKA